MPTKTVDSNVESFFYRTDLSIDPPLPDSKIKSAGSDMLTLRQFKDEDVIFDPIEGIKVVTKNVTQVTAVHTPDTYQYGAQYKVLKDGLKALAKVAKDAGSKLNGQVLVRADQNHFFRLSVVDNIVKVEGANLAWPDGTTSPFPDGEGA